MLAGHLERGLEGVDGEGHSGSPAGGVGGLAEDRSAVPRRPGKGGASLRRTPDGIPALRRRQAKNAEERSALFTGTSEICERWRREKNAVLAEGGGFEPPIGI